MPVSWTWNSLRWGIVSRSRRRTPIIGICANARTSEKDDKKIWHKAYRAAVRQALKAGKEPPHFRDHSNPYSFNKDGKVWIGNGGWWRRDPKKAMRK